MEVGQVKPDHEQLRLCGQNRTLWCQVELDICIPGYEPEIRPTNGCGVTTRPWNLLESEVLTKEGTYMRKHEALSPL